TIVRGSLKPVLDTIRTTAPESHVEITTLVIPGLNDADEEMDKEASFIASVDENIPLHISRFFPRYHLQNIPPTPVSTLDRLRRTASRHLKNVYIGNV
ncbi:MAG: radical SAM protein, partial [Saccharofermentanales bacterium]